VFFSRILHASTAWAKGCGRLSLVDALTADQQSSDTRHSALSAVIIGC